MRVPVFIDESCLHITVIITHFSRNTNDSEINHLLRINGQNFHDMIFKVLEKRGITAEGYYASSLKQIGRRLKKYKYCEEFHSGAVVFIDKKDIGRGDLEQLVENTFREMEGHDEDD